MHNPMLELALSEGHRKGLPSNPPPPQPLSVDHLIVLRIASGKGGVKRTGELPKVTGIDTVKIGNIAAVLLSRRLIQIEGEKRSQIFHATTAGLKELERSDV